MKVFTKLTSGLALLAAFALTSCEKDEIDLNIVPVDGVTLTLVPEGGGEAKSFTMSTPHKSEDGKQYGELLQEDIRLKANTTYNATVTYFSYETGKQVSQNESIKKEEEVYTIAYKKSQNNLDEMRAELAIIVTDKKANGSPLGLQAKFTTGQAGIETLHIDLNAEKRQGNSYMGGTVFNALYFVDVQN